MNLRLSSCFAYVFDSLLARRTVYHFSSVAERLDGIRLTRISAAVSNSKRAVKPSDSLVE